MQLRRMSSTKGHGALRLADTQSAIRDAVVADAPARILSALVERGDRAYRLSIHQRHFAASLIAVIRNRYPTLEWLVGSDFLNAAAQRFIHEHPPVRPCMAEYGGDFPHFLRTLPASQKMPWLPDVARLEWHLGFVSVAIDHPPVALQALAAFEHTDLAELGLQLQPGLAYFASAWPIDALMRLRLSGEAPERLSFEPETVSLEIRGARGDFRMSRLSAGTFAFRHALAGGASLIGAIAAGETAEPNFDAGTALAATFGEGLVHGIATLTTGDAK
jgi:hypothetical protein